MNRPFRIEGPVTKGEGAADGRPAGAGVAPTRRALWILSDLRLDRDPGLAPPGSLPDFDALLVAGNVGPGLGEAMVRLAAALGGRQGERPVIVVPGVVEYRSPVPMAEALARGRELAHRLGFRLLSDEATRFGPSGGGGTVVVGATLWTDWELRRAADGRRARIVARTAWRDAAEISLRKGRPLTPLDTLAMHARSRAFIEDGLGSAAIASLALGAGPNAVVHCARPGDVSVVLTCHAPTPRSLPDDWEGWHADEWLAASLASEASEAMHAWGAPSLWVHGNVPRAVDHVVGRTRVVANPRFGPHGDTGFDPGLVVHA